MSDHTGHMPHGPKWSPSEPTDENRAEAARLVAMGYRRTSNSARMVSRIDRPDWVVFLARQMRRAPADFYVPGEPHPAANWCDHYRRVYSSDKVRDLKPEVFRLIPGSDWDACGYVEPRQ